jgi:hypothetical protein
MTWSRRARLRTPLLLRNNSRPTQLLYKPTESPPLRSRRTSLTPTAPATSRSLDPAASTRRFRACGQHLPLCQPLLAPECQLDSLSDHSPRLLSIVDTLVLALSIVFAAALRRMWAIPGVHSKASRKALVWRRSKPETCQTCPASEVLTVMASFSSVLEVECGALVWAEGRALEVSAKTAALAVERPRKLCISIFAQLSKSTLYDSALACLANTRSLSKLPAFWRFRPMELRA